MDRDLVGVPKQGPVQKWLEQRKQWDRKFATTKRKVCKRFIDDLAIGYEEFGAGEFPPPTALAGRRRKAWATKQVKRSKSMGLALWSLWGSKHDKMTMNREEKADRDVDMLAATGAEGEGARSFADIERQGVAVASPTSPSGGDNRGRSRRRRVTYERQDENGSGRSQEDVTTAAAATATTTSTTPEPEIGIGTTGKRAYVDGIAVPFSLNKEAETASMMTLTSNMSLLLHSPRVSTNTPRSPMSPVTTGTEEVGQQEEEDTKSNNANNNHKEDEDADADADKGKGKETKTQTPPLERPGLDTFVTAAEVLPTIANGGQVSS